MYIMTHLVIYSLLYNYIYVQYQVCIYMYHIVYVYSCTSLFVCLHQVVYVYIYMCQYDLYKLCYYEMSYVFM